METEYEKEESANAEAEFTGERIPMDFDSLKKGDKLQVEFLERILRAENGSVQYAFACLGLRAQIENECGFVVRGCDNGALEILYDAEASDYLHKRQKNHLRGLGRDLGRMQSLIDTSQLTANEKERYNRHQVEHAFIYQAAIRARNKVVGRLPQQEAQKELEG